MEAVRAELQGWDRGDVVGTGQGGKEPMSRVLVNHYGHIRYLGVPGRLGGGLTLIFEKGFAEYSCLTAPQNVHVLGPECVGESRHMVKGTLRWGQVRTQAGGAPGFPGGPALPHEREAEGRGFRDGQTPHCWWGGRRGPRARKGQDLGLPGAPGTPALPAPGF